MHESRIAGRTGCASARPVRVARTRAPRVLLAAVALVILLLQVDTAYALPGSEKNSYPLGDILMNEDIGSNRGTVVYGAANEFFATLCLIGRKSDYLQLSNDQLAQLSNEGTGGAFWELSQRWSNLASDGSPEDWPVGITLAMQGQGLISDPAYIWWADYSYYETDSLFKRARADYLTIYNGGHLGGGGSVGDVLEFDILVKYSNQPYNGGYTVTATDGTTYTTRYMAVNDNLKLMPNNLKLRIPRSYLSIDHIDDKTVNDGYCFITQFATRLSCTIALSSSPDDSSTLQFNTASESFTANGQSYSTNYYSSVQTLPPLYTIYNSYLGGYTFDGNTITVTGSGTASKNWVYSNSQTTPIKDVPLTGRLHGVSPVIPPNNWGDPIDEPVPTPPDVPEPEPGGPDVEPPDPYMPIVDPPSDPDPVTDPYVVVVAPDSQDIIPWLRAILQAINNVGDKLNAESTELQNALNKTFFNNLSKLLKNLKGEFIQDYTSWLDRELEWFNSDIHDYFVDLQTYLYHLFEWLADQMNFEVNLETDPYDDTSLLNWLRRIYNKLGSDGGPNTRPVDPSTDPEGFLDWLRRMIAEFILGLGASASDFVSDLGDLLSRLFDKFPFSVPWDLLGILGLLDAAPVAPRVNFTIPLTIGNQEFSWTVDINLSGWSTYMESVRTIILVSFISWLAWLTPSVLRDLDPGDFL